MTDSTSVLSEFTPAAVDGVPTEVQVAQAGRTIEVTEPNGMLIKFDVKLVDGRLKGSAVASRDGQTRNAVLDVGRAK